MTKLKIIVARRRRKRKGLLIFELLLLSRVIAMFLNNVGANLAGLVKTALFVNPTGVVSTELAMTIPGSASVRKDGWDLTAIAQKIQVYSLRKL